MDVKGQPIKRNKIKHLTKLWSSAGIPGRTYLLDKITSERAKEIMNVKRSSENLTEDIKERQLKWYGLYKGWMSKEYLKHVELETS